MTSAADPSALKDDEASHPIPGAWRSTLQLIVQAFVSGDYALSTPIAGVESVNDTTAAQISRYISDYGATLIDLPEATWSTSVAQWYGTHWEFVVDLWTKEEGRSDLVLSGRVTETDGAYTFNVYLVHVP
jgi:hypothetical protein